MSFDQYEFNSPDSEQSLELAFSGGGQHRDLGAFLAECGASACSGRIPEAGWGRWGMVRAYLLRHAGLELPHLDGCREIALLRDDWDELELAMAIRGNMVWFRWFTTA
jgi:hypothetical protein